MVDFITQITTQKRAEIFLEVITGIEFYDDDTDTDIPDKYEGVIV